MRNFIKQVTTHAAYKVIPHISFAICFSGGRAHIFMFIIVNQF